MGKLRHREVNALPPLRVNRLMGCLVNTSARLVATAELCGQRQRKRTSEEGAHSGMLPPRLSPVAEGPAISLPPPPIPLSLICGTR